jgi:nitroreductase
MEQPADPGTLVGKSPQKSESDDDIKHGQISQGSPSDCGLSDTSSNVSSAPSLASVRGLRTSNGSDPSSGPEPNDAEGSTDDDAHHGKSAGSAESSMNSRTVLPENGWRIPTAATSDAVSAHNSENTQSYAAEAEQALSSAGIQDRTVAGTYTRYLEARGRGQSDVVVRSACGQVVNACTAAATKHLQDDNFGVVWQLLSFAQVCSAEHQQLWSGIYNCKACFCQRQGKHLRALRYLRRAAEINAMWKLGAEQRANTHLNMCAVLSRLQRHKKSLDAARMALRWAKVALAEAKKLPPAATESGMNSRLVDAGTLVALALHNAAVQHEHLREYSDARAAYHSAGHAASQCLGEHTITKTILANLQRCEAAAAAAGQRKQPAHLRSSASVPSISRTGSRASLPRVQY